MYSDKRRQEVESIVGYVDVNESPPPIDLDKGTPAMVRSLFLALGAYTCLLGVEALALDRAILKKPENAPAQQAEPKVIVPPEWAPWSLMATGAVVVLYSFTLPSRARG